MNNIKTKTWVYTVNKEIPQAMEEVQSWGTQLRQNQKKSYTETKQPAFKLQTWICLPKRKTD